MNAKQAQNAALITSEVAISAATVYLVIRMVGGTDALRMLKMRLARTGEKVCMGNAVVWANAASVMSSIYDDARMVSL